MNNDIKERHEWSWSSPNSSQLTNERKKVHIPIWAQPISAPCLEKVDIQSYGMKLTPRLSVSTMMLTMRQFSDLRRMVLTVIIRDCDNCNDWKQTLATSLFDKKGVNLYSNHIVVTLLLDWGKLRVTVLDLQTWEGGATLIGSHY